MPMLCRLRSRTIGISWNLWTDTHSHSYSFGAQFGSIAARSVTSAAAAAQSTASQIGLPIPDGDPTAAAAAAAAAPPSLTDYTVLKGPDGYGLKLGDTGLVTSSTKAAAEAGVPVGGRVVAVDGVAVKGKAEILAAVRGSTAEGGVVLSVAPVPVLHLHLAPVLQGPSSAKGGKGAAAAAVRPHGKAGFLVLNQCLSSLKHCLSLLLSGGSSGSRGPAKHAAGPGRTGPVSPQPSTTLRPKPFAALVCLLRPMRGGGVRAQQTGCGCCQAGRLVALQLVQLSRLSRELGR